MRSLLAVIFPAPKENGPELVAWPVLGADGVSAVLGSSAESAPDGASSSMWSVSNVYSTHGRCVSS